jgi:hypothetical protein
MSCVTGDLRFTTDLIVRHVTCLVVVADVPINPLVGRQMSVLFNDIICNYCAVLVMNECGTMANCY